MAKQLLIFLSIVLCASTVAADKEKPEIQFLLNAIGSSDCQFFRNGKEHSPEDAEDHLSMKYSRTKRHIKSAEDFIDKLATESSWSGKPYTIRCADAAEQLSSAWLYEHLETYRTESAAVNSQADTS
jgi:hypothetical protein